VSGGVAEGRLQPALTLQPTRRAEARRYTTERLDVRTRFPVSVTLQGRPIRWAEPLAILQERRLPAFPDNPLSTSKHWRCRIAARSAGRGTPLAVQSRQLLMTQPAQALDVSARRLIRATEEPLRRWIGVQQLDNDLLGALYLRVLEALERGQSSHGAGAVEDIALTIYLTASAWQSRQEPPLELLSSLHQVIAKTLSDESTTNASVDGARRNR
jgi:hypothetical protein